MSAPAVDLLDLGEGSPVAARAEEAAPPVQEAPAPGPAPAPAAPKTGAASVSLLDFGAEEEVVRAAAPALTKPRQPGHAPAAAAAEPAKAQQQPNDDPFAALSAVQPAAPPPPSLLSGGGGSGATATAAYSPAPAPAGGGFSFQGKALQPLALDTQAFGQRWPRLRFQTPVPVPQTRLGTLDLLAGALRLAAGLHIVEAIPRTAEVIAAGALGGGPGPAVLVHAKLHAARGARWMC